MALEPYILLIDDDPVILEILMGRLEAVGYRVTTAADAWQGVIQVQGVQVGLIIADIMMPGGGSGLDAYKKIRSITSLSPQLPVIFLTGLKLDDVKKSMPDDPYVRYLSKPVDFKLLGGYLKDLIGIDRPLDKPQEA